MGNFFIGFPVPRARIADMITGKASPKNHHEQHENGGDDEVDCTGLEGAGGITLPFDDLFWETWFESLDGWNQIVSGTGEITLDEDYVELGTGLTPHSSVRIDKLTGYPTPALSYSKKQQLKTKIWLRSKISKICDAWIVRGNPGIVPHFGFIVSGGKLYGTVGNNSVNTTLELETLGAADYIIERKLVASFKPGVECRFFVDGNDLGAISTNLPSGPTGNNYLMYLKLENPGVAEQKYLFMSMYQFWQEA